MKKKTNNNAIKDLAVITTASHTEKKAKHRNKRETESRKSNAVEIKFNADFLDRGDLLLTGTADVAAISRI